jgi:hypothetical protein
MPDRPRWLPWARCVCVCVLSRRFGARTHPQACMPRHAHSYAPSSMHASRGCAFLGSTQAKEDAAAQLAQRDREHQQQLGAWRAEPSSRATLCLRHAGFPSVVHRPPSCGAATCMLCVGGAPEWLEAAGLQSTLEAKDADLNAAALWLHERGEALAQVKQANAALTAALSGATATALSSEQRTGVAEAQVGIGGGDWSEARRGGAWLPSPRGLWTGWCGGTRAAACPLSPLPPPPKTITLSAH